MPSAANSTYGVRSQYGIVARSPSGPGSSGNDQRVGWVVANTQRPPGRSTRATSFITAAESATNGTARYQRDKVRVAIIGVGNCANSLVQGVYHYADDERNETIPGLMHNDLGGYHPRDIEFTCAFDINKTKVGKDLAQAIWANPNDTIKFTNKVPKKIGVPVYRGMTHDGLGKYLSE